MERFYMHPETKKLHFVASAGGTGGGQTGTFDGVATPEDIKAHPRAYNLHIDNLAREEAAAAADKQKTLIPRPEVMPLVPRPAIMPTVVDPVVAVVPSDVTP